MPMEYELTIERQAAAIAYWQRGLHMREDVFAVFDVFDPSGEFVKQMELHGPGNALKDGIFFDGPQMGNHFTKVIRLVSLNSPAIS